MNIGIVVDNDLNNDNRVLREAEILKKSGHNIFALCFSFDNNSYRLIDGIIITRLRINRKLKNLLFFLLNTIPVYEWFWSSAISRFISTNNLDVIHSHDLYMAKCTAMGIRKSGRKTRLILDLHENFAYSVTTYNWTKGFLRSLLSRPGSWAKKEGKYLYYADGIVVLSKEYMEKLKEQYDSLNKKNFCILPNVPDLGKMNSSSADKSPILFRKKSQVMFYYGIIAERRGIFDALSVFSEVVQAGHELEFLIIGPTDKKDRKRFETIINSDILLDKITYIPWIDHSKLTSYLEVSDFCIAPFLINPQHESGVANKIYEYMFGGKPVIASGCRPQKAIIEKHQCGIIYEDNNGFREAIIKLLNDSELKEQMGKNGHDAVISEYNLDKVGKILADLYSSFN
jgi:glycosyltransferase involved in cell wall biosynthesis